MGVLWSQSFSPGLAGNTRDKEDPWGEMQTAPIQGAGRQRDSKRDGNGFKETSQLFKIWSQSHEEKMVSEKYWPGTFTCQMAVRD